MKTSTAGGLPALLLCSTALAQEPPLQVAIWGSPRDQPITITREDRDLIRLTGSAWPAGPG